MKRRWALWMVLLLFVSAMTGCQKSETPTTPATSVEKEQPKDVSNEVTLSNDIDGEKHEITYEKAPERIATLSGHERRCYWNWDWQTKSSDMVIWTMKYRNDSVSKIAVKLTKLSDGNPSKEDLLKVNPDFLWMYISPISDCSRTDFLKEHNIKFYVPRVEYALANMESVYQDFENLGRIFSNWKTVPRRLSRI